jgi:hypothetical protein
MRLYASICVFEESASKRWMICVQVLLSVQVLFEADSILCLTRFSFWGICLEGAH